jgi:AcrR family transcriptional regulator
MAARAEAKARTRQQIIDAAAHRVRVAPEPLTLRDIAARAGVSRATIYRHFGSVTDLLDGVAADLLAQAHYGQLLAALELPDPIDALRQVIMAGTGIWASDPVLVRNLTGLARVQPEALPVIAQLERGRLAAMEHLANRLHRTGRLRRDLTPAHAVDLLLISTAFAAWDELVTSRNRSPAAATAAITDLAVTAVVRGPEPGSTRASRHRHVGSRKSSTAVTRKGPAGITAPDPKHSQPGQTAAT